MEPIDNNKQERTAQMQRKVLEHLTESGNVSYACKRAGINRDTFYEWKKEDKLFADNATLAVSYGKSFVNDLAHSQLIRNIQEGNMQAVRFQLISCHDDYKPRRALPPEKEMDEDDRPIAAIIITDYEPKSSSSPSRSTSRSPTPVVPSAPPKQKKKDEEKTKLAAPTSTKPAPPEPERGIVQFKHPPARKIWGNGDDDDGWEIDGDLIWGKRGR